MIKWFRSGLLPIALYFMAAVAQAKNVLIFAPHPDDEVLGFAGVIKTALNDGDRVQVVLATGGEVCSPNPARTTETVNGLGSLGLGPENIKFLGYRNGIVDQLYMYADENQFGTLPQYLIDHCNVELPGWTNWSETKGTASPHPEFHKMAFGVSAPMTKAYFMLDILTILKGQMPEDIYVTGMQDYHAEHSALFRFVVDAIVLIKKTNPAYSPRLHEALIHSLDGEASWPLTNPDAYTVVPFSKPVQLEATTSWIWSAVEHKPVPDAMQGTPWNNTVTNSKFNTIHQYPTQVVCPGCPTRYFESFVKSDEIFWLRDFSNIALLATATASSVSSFGQTADKAIDGQIDGYCDGNGCLNSPGNGMGFSRLSGKEWATQNQNAGSWIQLNWARAYNIDKIVLYDRINSFDRIVSGTLSFSNGTSVSVGSLANNGAGNTITFSPRSVTWVRFTISQTTGAGSTGLAEMEVFERNLAKYATVTASTQNTSTGQVALKAVDGIVDGFPNDAAKEWATLGQLGGAWIQLNWTQSYTIDRVILFDRPNQGDHIISGTLQFSDGSSVPVGTLSNSGSGNTIRFRPRSTSWVKLVVNSATGYNIGLAELEAYEALSAASTNQALYSTATSSSENLVTGQSPMKAIDEIKSGYPVDFTKEWASANQGVGAWIRLDFAQPASVNKAILFDRPNTGDWIKGGTLSFSNGTTVPVGQLNNDGTGLTVNFPARTTSWIKFTVNSFVGGSAGLSEFEVY